MDILGLARHGLNNFEQIGVLAVLIVAFISLIYAWLLRGIVMKRIRVPQKCRKYGKRSR